MQEYFTEAVVLNCEPSGDLDSRASLFTKRFGKLTAKAKSARKITSKLAGHLQPGNLVSARLVEKNGLHIADALKISKFPLPPSDLYFLSRLLPESELEPTIWRLIFSKKIDWIEILRVLGWDPKETLCHGCAKKTPVAFDTATQEFFCADCALKVDQNDLLYIH
jgi:recombinational DNA repair protein (RecF pathway)